MIDVIIPIYNAYEDLVKCVSSIWKHTDLKNNRLILVNDKSTDSRIKSYLDDIKGENIIVHHSEKNGGFSASVNIGMGYSDDNDVILLNSDTIVTSNWVNKIQECAYSEETIATVTPLSNSATLASFPIFGQDNPIPENVSIDELAEIVERCSFKSYPQITVAVGFCMFIKRNVIKEIGNFDEKTFGRGYGEENDFCCRAELMGYKHVLCDNTFVYHKGTGSFMSEQKKALIEEHVGILEERYPASMRNNHIFCMSRPYQYIRDNISMYLKMYNGKKNILYVLHSDFKTGASNNVGGTQLHVKDLTMNLLDQYNVFVASKEDGKIQISCYIDEKTMLFEFDDKNVNAYYTFRDNRQANLWENILSAFHIDLVHVHHISRMSLDIYYIASNMNIPIITSIHDFYNLCPTYFMYNINGGVCKGQDTSLCEQCMQEQLRICHGDMYIRKWRSEMMKALALSSIFVYPSNSAKEMFCSVYPLSTPSMVIGHGISDDIQNDYVQNYELAECTNCCIEKIDFVNENVIEGWAYIEGFNNKNVGVIVQLLQNNRIIQEVCANKSYRLDVDNAFGQSGQYISSGFQARIMKEAIGEKHVDVRVLLTANNHSYIAKEIPDVSVQQDIIGEGMRVAFIGGISAVKGSNIAYEMISKGEDIEWFIFGNIAPDEKLSGYEAPNLHKYGAYERKNIKTILQNNKISVVCIMSRCSETFCYTLSEAIDAKIPVLAYDIGAVGERVRENKLGILFSLDASAEMILSKLRSFCQDDEWIEVEASVKKYSVKTTKQMADEYKNLYEKTFVAKKQYSESDAKLLWDAASS